VDRHYINIFIALYIYKELLLKFIFKNTARNEILHVTERH